MPKLVYPWRHITLGTSNSWHPADPRGFRAKNQKIHSSGDYKNPPPDGEHRGLHEYSHETSGEAVGMHTHLLTEWPGNLKEVKHVVGQCKSKSSHAIRKWVRGRVWARGGSYKPVRNQDHHRNTLHYIMNQEDAWVWSFRDEVFSRQEEFQP